jgi:hypothetical protein
VEELVERLRACSADRIGIEIEERRVGSALAALGLA